MSDTPISGFNVTVEVWTKERQAAHDERNRRIWVEEDKKKKASICETSSGHSSSKEHNDGKCDMRRAKELKERCVSCGKSCG